jgi:hypothetical protein
MKSPWMPMDGFWKSLSQEEWHELFQTGRLTGATLERYLRMNDFQGEPPAYIEIQVRKSDVDRLIRELKKKGRK